MRAAARGCGIARVGKPPKVEAAGALDQAMGKERGRSRRRLHPGCYEWRGRRRIRSQTRLMIPTMLRVLEILAP